MFLFVFQQKRLCSMPAILTRQTLCHMSSSVVPMLTCAGVMQCVATAVILADMVFFDFLTGTLGKIAQHAFNSD